MCGAKAKGALSTQLFGAGFIPDAASTSRGIGNGCLALSGLAVEGRCPAPGDAQPWGDAQAHIIGPFRAKNRKNPYSQDGRP